MMFLFLWWPGRNVSHAPTRRCLERFVDNQGILADDLVRLKPEQTLLN
jgi:hypothetical protein